MTKNKMNNKVKGIWETWYLEGRVEENGENYYKNLFTLKNYSDLSLKEKEKLKGNLKLIEARVEFENFKKEEFISFFGFGK